MNRRSNARSSDGIKRIPSGTSGVSCEELPTYISARDRRHILGLAGPSNYRLQAIMDELDRSGVPTAGGGRWRLGTMAAILHRTTARS